jgi:hypothetical protein
MPAGVDVAKLFLPPQSPVSIGSGSGWTALPFIRLMESVADTTDPLYLLVDDRTASASRDSHRRSAVITIERYVVGPSKTFGKGRIQQCARSGRQEVASHVTKAKYVAPSGRDIHGIWHTAETGYPRTVDPMLLQELMALRSAALQLHLAKRTWQNEFRTLHRRPVSLMRQKSNA